MSASPNGPNVIPLDEPVVLPLRELSAAFAVLASLDNLLLDPAVAPAFLKELTLRSIGLPGKDTELSKTDRFAAAPPITDADTARVYILELRDRLGAYAPNGPFDSGPDRIW